MIAFARRAVFASISIACAISCNALTGTNDLQSVDCLGDCRSAPGAYCGIGLQCAAGEQCCVTSSCLDSKCSCSGDAGCASPAVPLACDGSEDCAAPTARVCCVKLVLQETPACTVTLDPAGASCTSGCVGLPGTCSGSSLARVCHQTSDCDGDDQCCALTSPNGGVHVCAPKNYALDEGHTCFP